MKKQIKFYILIISIFSFNTYSQKKIIANTKIIKVEYVYVNVIKTYERVAQKGYKSIDLFQKLGNSYYSNNELEKAAKYYGELFIMTSDLEPEYYYHYAQSLNFIGQNDKANEILDKLCQKPEMMLEYNKKMKVNQ
ncbi:tetratricopeptide repeat protein [Flavobacterium sp. WC2409]|uniref:Tetratricopeptide repeat protein n=1 Tax=Flavobacterium sp. WC2409 TaxID=3234139 RepID=A0AB39W6Q0_9FLAO